MNNQLNNEFITKQHCCKKDREIHHNFTDIVDQCASWQLTCYYH